METFQPPSLYTFESELQGPVPRPVPDRIRLGPFEQRRRKAVLAAVIAGVLCFALGQAPFWRELGYYILPLKYLRLIGLGILVCAAIGYLRIRFAAGPYRYIERGIPLVARITALVKAPSLIYNGQPTQHAFNAAIEYRDPDSREVMTAQVQSVPFDSGRKDSYTTTYQEGQYVTAVCLPGRTAKTIQLYHFLNFHDGLGVVRRSSGSGGDSTAKTVAAGVAIAAIVFVLFWNVYAFGRYHPVAFNYAAAAWPMVIGGIVLGGAFLVGTYLADRKERSRRMARNAQAQARGEAVEAGAASFWSQPGPAAWFVRIILFVGSPLLGAVITLCACFTLNALTDTSPAEYRPVKIDEIIMTTHSGIFREYAVKYTWPGSDEKQSFMTTPRHIATLLDVEEGVAEVHQGRLGWPWVKTIRR